MSIFSPRSSLAISVFAIGTFSQTIFARPTSVVDDGSTASPIMHVGDIFPGRPGDFVGQDQFSDTPFLAGMPDSFGDITFTAQRASDLSQDVLIYHASDGTISPRIQTGAITTEGFAINQIFGVNVNSNASGQTLTYGVIRDISSGNTSISLLPITTANTVSVAGAVNIPVPNQPQGSWIETTIATGGLGAITYNLNDNGLVAYEASFTVGSTTRQGVYNWTPAGGLQRVIDSSQAVPGHSNAQWVPYVRGSVEDTPFDPYQLQLTNSGDAIFMARFKIGSTLSRALFRGSTTNGLSAIVDPARGDQVPGRAPGVGFFSIPDSPLANKNGQVAFEGIENSQFNRGVYMQNAAGQAVVKIHDNNDSLVGLPAGSKQLLFGLLAMNDTGHTVIDTTYRDGENLNAALMACSPTGESKLIARADQLTGLPDGATNRDFHGTTAINDAGDILSEVAYDSPDGSAGTLYAYLNDTNQFVRVLAPGDVIDGMAVDDFRVFVPSSSGGFGNTFTDDRHFIASVHLVPLPGASPDETDTWGLYDFQVVPEPTSTAAVGLILLTGLRRGRRT